MSTAARIAAVMVTTALLIGGAAAGVTGITAFANGRSVTAASAPELTPEPQQAVAPAPREGHEGHEGEDDADD